MITMPLGEVARLTGAPAPPEGTQGLPVTSVEFDSRRVAPGALFVALHGEHTDGHCFAAAAARRGAVAVLGSAPTPGSALPLLRLGDDAAVLSALAELARHSAATLAAAGLTIIGVTGSAGKTSTKDLIAAVLTAHSDAEAVVAPPESFNNELGHPYTVLRAGPGTRYLVLELSARGVGHIAALARIAPPRIGAVLNVGHAHIGEFGSVDAIAVAKGELVEALPDADAGGVAILNADDPRVAAMASRTRAAVVRTSASGAPAADVRAEVVTIDGAARASFTLAAAQGRAPVSMRLAGAHQVANALAAAAVGLAAGVDVAVVAAALSAAAPASKWRMAVSELPGGITLVNDAYNANPESMTAALHALATMAAGRRSWAVLGEMAELGETATAAHGEIGRLAVRLGIDRLVVVGQAARALHLGARLEGSWAGESVLVDGVDEAVALLRAGLGEGDVVLVKASRAAGLERVAQSLTAALTEPAVPPAGPDVYPLGGIDA